VETFRRYLQRCWAPRNHSTAVFSGLVKLAAAGRAALCRRFASYCPHSKELACKKALPKYQARNRACQGLITPGMLLALQNAFYQLLHASSLERGVVDTVRAGGDTDTNAAIAGALLGAVHGRDVIPQQWFV